MNINKHKRCSVIEFRTFDLTKQFFTTVPPANKFGRYGKDKKKMFLCP